MFWLKKKDEPKMESPSSSVAMSSREYEFLTNRVAEIQGELKTFKSDVKNLQEDVDLLRGKLSARLGAIKKQAEKEQESTNPADIYMGIG